EADVTVTRLSALTFLVLTGHPSQVRDQSYIKSHADPDWRFEIFDATSGMGLLTLHGPSSRAIVAALSPDDLSTAAFPFGAAREIDVAYARVWAIRRSFFGELGYELLFPTEFAAGLYEALIEEGSPHGLRHAGLFAMNHCRMEKAFRHFGHDIAEQDTPLEAGLGFAVDWDKPGRSVGHEALEAQRGQAPATRHRTVAIALRDATVTGGPFLLHNEPVWLQDTIVGHVTSGAWGFRIGRSLGLATLENPDGVSRDWLDANRFDVDVAGVRHPIDVRLRPFYDANGERMRA
ncbi:MAG: aminomethyltransferase family protein, partial [Alphaproteobacteria bacterium]